MLEWIGSLGGAAIRLSVPILLAAGGETLVQRAGMINLGLEGMILSGAFCAMVGSFVWSSAGEMAPWGGLLFSACVGIGWAGVFGYFCIVRGADQIVIGTAINLTAYGLTAFLNRLAFREITGVEGFSSTARGGLYLGAVGTVLAIHLFLTRTHLGLLLRAAGEHPRAVDTVGVSVVRLRFASALVGGALGGMGGGYLLLANVPSFIEGMSAGRGFIAIALVIFGRWNALGVLLATLFFGLADATQVRLEAMGVGIPDEFLKMLPYLLTLAVLTGYVGKTRAPAALGIPYRRE